MICPKCHNEVPVGSNICPSCGKDITRVRLSAEGNAPAGAPVRRRQGAQPPQKNPQALIIAAGLMIVFVVLLVLLFRAIFGEKSPSNPPGGKPSQTIEAPEPSPTFKIFGVDINTPEPVTTADPLAGLQLEATPTPAAPTPEPEYETLQKGSKGDAVKRLQEALIAMGYLEDGGADGDYGNGTLNAVKEFQKDNGLSADGKAGKQTLSTLYRLYGGDIDSGKSKTNTSTVTTTDVSSLILNQPG